MSDNYYESGKLGRLRKKLISFKLSPKAVFIVMGIASTIWFLIRVIPKPQRAAYPCMRTAAPVMSGFVIYLLSLGGSFVFFRKSIANFRKAKYVTAFATLILCLTLFAIFNLADVKNIYSNVLGVQWTKGVLPDSANMPVGDPRGIFPGRVAWTFDVDATNENCPNTITDAYFMAKNTNQDTINKLANEAVKIIGGKSTVAESWDAIFKSFNKRKTGTETGYVAGQKIFIKINNGQAGWSITTGMADKGQYSNGTKTSNIAMSNTSPQAVFAFLIQLIDSCGVAQTDITIGEPMTHVYQSMYDIVHPKYPNVILIDKDSITRISGQNVNTTSFGRTKSKGWKADAIVFSDKGKVMTNAIKDNLMNEMFNADYLINIAALKAHARSGVTFCAKNHFGSSTHGGSYSADRLHSGSINANANNDDLTNARGDYHMYRVLTDLIGHDKLGGNTVLFVVDGLWGGIEATDMPVKWKMAPFNNDFPSSLFISQDEVALESVCLDFLRAEANVNTYFNNRPFFPAVDDFLHQAASKANWADSIKDLNGKWYPFAGYDPEGDGTYMSSMGIHEHWNNSTDKQYSRNLYTNGTGIELLTYPSNLVAKGNALAKSIEITVFDSTGNFANTRVVINGSNYFTNADGKVTVGDLKENSKVVFSASRKGYYDQSSQVTLNGETTVVSLQMHAKKPVVIVDPGTGISNTYKNVTFSAYPNPAVESTTISYQLKTTSNVSIYLISIEGKIVKQFRNEVLSAGIYADKVSTSGLNSGNYICVLKTAGELKTFKLVIK